MVQISFQMNEGEAEPGSGIECDEETCMLSVPQQDLTA